MKKLHIFGVAVFAFSMISAVSASAGAELLLEGATIPVAVIEAELLLTDLTSAGEATVDCSSSLDGTMQPEGKDFLIDKLLVLGGASEVGSNLGGTALSCTGLELCEEPALASVWTQNLPWLVEFESMTVGTETKYLFHLTEDGAGLPAYEMDCTTLLGLVEDLCEGLVTGFLDIEPTDLLALFSLKEQEEGGEEALCSFTKEHTGHIEGTGLFFVAGKTLTVSG